MQNSKPCAGRASQRNSRVWAITVTYVVALALGPAPGDAQRARVPGVSYSPVALKQQSLLRQELRRLKAAGVTRRNGARAVAFSTPWTRFNARGEVQVYVEPGAGLNGAAAALRAVGGHVEIVSLACGVVQGWVPIDAIDALASKREVRFVRCPDYARVRRVKRSRVGSVTTQGASILKATDVQNLRSITGSGVRVGIISDGMAGADQSKASDDLPSTIGAQSARPDSNLNAGAEGTAMLEIVHDMAPGASLFFSNPNTSAEMAQAMDILQNTFNCDVICDDLGFFSEGFFEDTAIATKAAQIVQAGKVYVSACGNEVNEHYEGDFNPVTVNTFLGSKVLHDFGGGDHSMDISLAPSAQLGVFFQWNDPFSGATNDYDVFIVNANEDTVLASSQNPQTGSQEPREEVSYFNNTGASQTVKLWVQRVSGSNRRLEMFAFGSDSRQFVVKQGSVFGHPAAEGAIGVAAISADDPGNDTVESFSSWGPSRVDFPFGGGGLVIRNTPAVTGIDGVAVTGNGGFPTVFFGTSAAAPHLAGVAALVLEKSPSLTPAQVMAAIQDNAVDIDTTGFDSRTGAGRADALAAVDNAGGGGTPTTCTLPGGVNTVTLPSSYTTSTLGSATLGGLFGAGFQGIATWNGSAYTIKTSSSDAAGTVLPPSSQGAGEGFFLKLSGTASVQLPGTAVKENAAFTTTSLVQDAWNLFGNPWPTKSLAWSAMQYKVNGASTSNLSDLWSQGSRSLEPYAWQIENGQRFLIVDTNAAPFLAGAGNVRTSIGACRSVWVRTRGTSSVQLVAPTASQSASSVATRTASTSGWAAALTAVTDSGSSNQVYIGVADRLAQALRVEAPPAADDSGVSLFILSPGAAPAAALIAPRASSSSWDVTIRSVEHGANVTVHWQDLNQRIGAGWRIELLDLSTGRRQSMRTTSSFSYRAPSTDGVYIRRVRIIATPSTTAPLRVTSIRSAPLGARGAGVGLTYTLSRAARVSVRILSPSGRTIQTLPPAYHPQGVHTAVWNGRASDGRTSPRGFYLVEIAARDDDGNQARGLGSIIVR